jgi:HNH endonuclease
MARGIPNTPEAFWARTQRVGECIEWMGLRIRYGYGRVSFRGKATAAHRVAWELSRGPIPPGLDICHTCDNPPCVNPLHLFVGTTQTNQADRTAKGRNWLSGRAGQANPAAVLTAEDVVTIRRLYAAGGWSHRTLAARFGVTYQTIGKVLRRERWAS